MENLLRDNKEKLFLWVDVETENVALNEQMNKPWQIAFALYKNNKIEEEFSYYIKWPEGLKVSAQAAKITHFDPSKIEELGQPPEKILDSLDKYLKKANIIAGHNVGGFESYVLASFYRKLGRMPFNIVPKMLDTFAIAKAIKLEIPYNPKENFAAWQYKLIHKIAKGTKTSLGALAKEFNIPSDPDKLHDALYDVKINIAVWNKLKYMVNIKE